MTKLDELLAECTVNQRRWIAARLTAKSDAAAARAIGIARNRVCLWKREIDLDAIVAELLKDPIAQALEIIGSAVPEAAKVKVDGLKSRKDGVKQAAATEILNRTIGSPAHKYEHTGAEGGPIQHEHRMTDAERITRIIELLNEARARRNTDSGD